MILYGRTIQILCAAFLLVLVCPLLIIAIFAIWLESGGKVIFKQIRIGQNCRTFKIYKLRTMQAVPLKGQNDLFPQKDLYVTRVGRCLRILKIDEFPQLFNIIKGDMNFVGPRPLRQYLHDFYAEEIQDFDKRYEILPGIIGLSQIIDPSDSNRELGLTCDLYYIRHRSLKLDLLIGYYTLVYVIFGIIGRVYSSIRRSIFNRIECDSKRTLSLPDSIFDSL